MHGYTYLCVDTCVCMHVCVCACVFTMKEETQIQDLSQSRQALLIKLHLELYYIYL